MTDLSRCPKCDGPADNGHDREVPPNPYHCTKCMAELQACVLCNHPMYAGIKCRLCGKVTEPEPPPEAQTEAEKIAYCAGWWAALEMARQAVPVQEPVAKVELMTTGGNAGLATRIVEVDDHLRERLRPGQLLYTAPPQRPAEPMVWTTQLDINWALNNPGRAGSFYANKEGPNDIALYTAPPQRKENNDE